MAHRLSADPRRRVLLVEAGIDTPPGRVPAEILDSYPMPLFHGDTYIWPGLDAAVTRDSRGRMRRRAYEQGRVMGGSSSINVQAANRGLPRDYEAWAALGAEGWAWDDVLPYFRRLETDLDCGGPLHGHDGPLPIRRILEPAWPPFAHAVARAFDATGLPRRVDQNGEFEDGIFPPAFSNRDDARVSAAAAYLDVGTRARPRSHHRRRSRGPFAGDGRAPSDRGRAAAGRRIRAASERRLRSPVRRRSSIAGAPPACRDRPGRCALRLRDTRPAGSFGRRREPAGPSSFDDGPGPSPLAPAARDLPARELAGPALYVRPSRRLRLRYISPPPPVPAGTPSADALRSTSSG